MTLYSVLQQVWIFIGSKECTEYVIKLSLEILSIFSMGAKNLRNLNCVVLLKFSSLSNWGNLPVIQQIKRAQ